MRQVGEIPHDYAERVYSGVLGKLIGVYLGRPFEGWSYEDIAAKLGDIRYYVHDREGVALRNNLLVVTDDDIAGTFVFARALEDHGYTSELSARQVGQTWLNYIVRERSVLWWGGPGNSTEHTAFMRLDSGVPAPQSGSIAMNGKAAAEQIGAQIFIDGWAMAAPGNPALAARLAGQAARVSHDGIAVHAAQLIAAMEAQAFVERDMDQLIDTGLAAIPADSTIRKVVDDVRRWHAQDAAKDWRSTRERIAAQYGYDRFEGLCHVVPNHALVILSLLYGQHSFDEALSISCTAGWDTDCNAGNVGCLMGLRGGLDGIDHGADWRGPVADRMYLSAGDGGGAITDAVQESWRLIDAGHRLAGASAPARPKDGARFSFAFPGSVQGFHVSAGDPSLVHPLALRNVAVDDGRALEVRYAALSTGRVARISTPTFIHPEVFGMPAYELVACPTLYPGQHLRASVSAATDNTASVRVALSLGHYDAHDRFVTISGPSVLLQPGGQAELRWTVPDLKGLPTYDIGLELQSPVARVDGRVLLHALDWKGAPELVLRRPEGPGRMWFKAWADAATHFTCSPRWEAFRLSQSDGVGMVTQGTRDWQDYAVESTVTPHLGHSWGLLARVQGLRRWYGLVFDRGVGTGSADGDRVSLVRMRDTPQTLASAPFAWRAARPCKLRIEVLGTTLRAWVDDSLLFTVGDAGPEALNTGGIGLMCDTGALSTDEVIVRTLRPITTPT